MSAYSNRAIYTPTNRAAYSPSTGRLLYADAAPISKTGKAGDLLGSASFSGSSGWTQANYEAAQDSALATLKADTYVYEHNATDSAYVYAYCKRYYGERAGCDHTATRWRFTLPANMRGSITHLALIANVGSARFWHLGGYWIYFAYDNAQWDDFGSILKIFFSHSSTAYASGNALYSGSADVTHSFEDINASHQDAGLEPLVGVDAANNLNIFPKAVLSCSGAISKVNAFTSDTIYLWAICTRPTYMPFLYSDPGSGYDNDFACNAEMRNPKLLVSIN